MAVRMGAAIPDRIANQPVLNCGLELYLNAFFDLDTTRSHGLGLTPISWLSIKEYATSFDFNVELTEDLFFFIRAMDKSHLDRMAAKQNQ